MKDSNNKGTPTNWVNRHTGAIARGVQTVDGRLTISDGALNDYACQNYCVGYGDGRRNGFCLGLVVSAIIVAGAALLDVLVDREKKKKKADNKQEGEN